jgi:hypothetical protein
VGETDDFTVNVLVRDRSDPDHSAWTVEITTRGHHGTKARLQISRSRCHLRRRNSLRLSCSKREKSSLNSLTQTPTPCLTSRPSQTRSTGIASIALATCAGTGHGLSTRCGAPRAKRPTTPPRWSSTAHMATFHLPATRHGQYQAGAIRARTRSRHCPLPRRDRRLALA